MTGSPSPDRSPPPGQPLNVTRVWLFWSDLLRGDRVLLVAARGVCRFRRACRFEGLPFFMFLVSKPERAERKPQGGSVCGAGSRGQGGGAGDGAGCLGGRTAGPGGRAGRSPGACGFV